eukprot:5833688-Alexandrium_andersonii.AAC.1
MTKLHLPPWGAAGVCSSQRMRAVLVGGEDLPQNLRAVLRDNKGAADEISDIAKDRGLTAQVALLLPASAE